MSAAALHTTLTAPIHPSTCLQGRTVNFANCVIIMTSNLGSEYLLQAAATRPASPAEAASIGQLGQDAAKELVMAQVRVCYSHSGESCAVGKGMRACRCMSLSTTGCAFRAWYAKHFRSHAFHCSLTHADNTLAI